LAAYLTPIVPVLRQKTGISVSTIGRSVKYLLQAVRFHLAYNDTFPVYMALYNTAFVGTAMTKSTSQ
jgi:hypothetical protein